MNFVVGLPMTPCGYDSIWVIVDRLTKFAHFLLMKTRYDVPDYAILFVKEIVRLHSVLTSIMLNRGS